MAKTIAQMETHEIIELAQKWAGKKGLTGVTFEDACQDFCLGYLEAKENQKDTGANDGSAYLWKYAVGYAKRGLIAGMKHIPLAPITDGEGNEIDANSVLPSKAINPLQALIQKEWDIALQSAMASLTPTQWMVVAYRYFDGMKQVEIAETLGLSKQRIEQIEKRALETLKGSN